MTPLPGRDQPGPRGNRSLALNDDIRPTLGAKSKMHACSTWCNSELWVQVRSSKGRAKGSLQLCTSDTLPLSKKLSLRMDCNLRNWMTIHPPHQGQLVAPLVAGLGGCHHRGLNLGSVTLLPFVRTTPPAEAVLVYWPAVYRFLPPDIFLSCGSPHDEYHPVHFNLAHKVV